MNALLVLTAGQTDVQLIEGEERREFAKNNCAFLHDEIERRAGQWRFEDTPKLKRSADADSLPQGDFILCTPKLDAVLQYLEQHGIKLRAALILETRRDARAVRGDPRFAGAILAARLKERGITNVQRVTFLTDRDSLEDREHPRDAVIRRQVVNQIDQAVHNCFKTLKPQRVIVAATGGIPPVSNLVEEIVRLYAVPFTDKVDPLEISDGSKATPPTHDRAVSRQTIPEPAESYQARRHALQLIEKGNLLGAWGAVQYLDTDDVEHRWTRVINWLACFAASLPTPAECDIPILVNPLKAVRAALRVELALRAGDIPRAVHGTVAFFESALWDHLEGHLVRHPDWPKRRWHKADPAPSEELIRTGDASAEDRRRPFESVKEAEGWYKVFDDDICAIRLAKHYLRQETLEKFGQKISGVRELRNDVAHNEPTPGLMEDSRRRMADALLWSAEGSFLSQRLVQGVLSDLGEPYPKRLLTSLMTIVQARLLEVPRL
jgi:hypothetical protein